MGIPLTFHLCQVGFKDRLKPIWYMNTDCLTQAEQHSLFFLQSSNSFWLFQAGQETYSILISRLFLSSDPCIYSIQQMEDKLICRTLDSGGNSPRKYL